MYQKNNRKHRYQRQWMFLTKRLRRWISEGDFANFSQKKRKHLLQRLRHLYRQMLRYQTTSRLRKALGSAALLLGLAAAPNLQAQVNFDAPVDNPFGLAPTENLRFECLADIDGDGDLDIVSMTYDEDSYGSDEQVLEYRVNVGEDNAPQFAAPNQDALLVNLPSAENGNYLAPSFADMDGDGDLDLLIGFYDYDNPAGVIYFENTGDAQNPVYGEPQTNPFNMNWAGSSAATPKAADIDDDGDLDLFSLYYEYDEQAGQEIHGFVYVENTGTATEPSFGVAQRQAFNLPMALDQVTFIDLGDIDNDGDVDLISGSTYIDDYTYEAPYTFYENVGDAENPDFAAGVENPFNLVSNQGLFLWPMLGDLDNDGDLDVLHGAGYNPDTYETKWVYQENLLLTVDVDDLQTANDDLRVFPTVSTGLYQLEITNSGSSAQVSLNVYNEAGQLIKQSMHDRMEVENMNLDLSAYPSGTYYLEARQGSARWTNSVVKQ